MLQEVVMLGVKIYFASFVLSVIAMVRKSKSSTIPKSNANEVINGGATSPVRTVRAAKRKAREVYGIEKGGMLNHLHFQMVIAIMAPSIKTVGVLIKQYLGWAVIKLQGAVVMCRSLRNVRMHTFTGMIGYCMKDLHKPHVKWYAKGIDAREIAEGRSLHAQYGQGELKHKVALTLINLFDRAYVYFENYIADPESTTLPNTLLRMLSTSKYYPSASWVVPKGVKRRNEKI